MKNIIKPTMLILLIAILPLFLTNSCTKTTKPRVYLIVKNIKNPFFNDIIEGVKSKGNNYEIIIKSGKNESDVTSQIQYLDYLSNDIDVNRNLRVKGLIITPSSSQNELISYLKKLNTKNIPIIIVDTKISMNILSKEGLSNIPFVGSSNIRGGEQAGKLLYKELGDRGNILVLNGVYGQETASDRNIGFHNFVDTLNFNVTERIANWSMDEAYGIVTSLISNGENFDGIFAANDMMALGAIKAYKNNNKKLPIIIGFDAIKEARKSIKNNEMYATIAQNPFEMGVKAIELIDSLYSKKKLSKNIYLIETQIIDNE
jgi:ribose transport system substrate-binding protein